MPSFEIVSGYSHNCKANRQTIRCKFCFFRHCWKHGIYLRTGTHSKYPQNPPVPIPVQRFLCRNPACKRTFSRLPENTLPYCRFTFKDFLLAAHLFQKGKNAYKIWKCLDFCEVSLKIIKRLCLLILRANVFLSKWYREIKLESTCYITTIFDLLLKRFTWSTITSRWYRAIYPKRLWPIFNPHNLTP